MSIDSHETSTNMTDLEIKIWFTHLFFRMIELKGVPSDLVSMSQIYKP